MTAEQIFSICGLIAVIGWMLLIFSPGRHWLSTVLAGQTIPLMLAVIYVSVLLLHGRDAKGGFNTLAEVSQLFSNQWALLAGWVHYLAFDLFTGSWEVRDAADRGIPRWRVVPCLLLTFLFGPAGLLSYFVLRSFHRSKPRTVGAETN